MLALLTIGVVMVNSAGMTIHTREPFTIEAILVSKTTLYAGLAMAALIACACLPLRRLFPSAAMSDASVLSAPAEPAIDEPLLSPAWFRALIREYINLWPLWAAALALVVLLASVYVPGIRSPKNGSHRWINLHLPGLESVQPSELAKWGLVILIAVYAACSVRRMRSFWLGLVPGLLAAGLVAGFVVIEDLGTGALMAAAAGIVLIAAGARIWHLLILLPVPVGGAVLAIVTNPYRMHRIESFLNPFLDPQGKGFHMIQSMSAISGGSVFGRGLGGGLQKFGYLPEDTTDFIFATICEELGVAGAAIVLFLMGALVWSVWGIVRRENMVVLKLIGLGVMATVGVQAAINLAVVTGLGPTKGIALPLISSGGTGWILTAAALGLVVAMDRAQQAELRRGTWRDDRPGTESDGYAMPALGAVAMSAAAAAATLPDVQPETDRTRIVAMAQPVVTDEAAAIDEEVEVAAAPVEVLDDAAEVISAADDADDDTAVPAEDADAEDAVLVNVEDEADATLAADRADAATGEAVNAEADETTGVAEAAEVFEDMEAVEELSASDLPLASAETDAEAPVVDVSPRAETSPTASMEDDIAAMFDGAVIAEPPPVRDLPPVIAEATESAAAEAPIVEPKPGLIIPGQPGKTGLLFELADPAAAPEVVVTRSAKNWLKPRGEESAT